MISSLPKKKLRTRRHSFETSQSQASIPHVRLAGYFALIVVLQWLLQRSQTTGGVILAPSINDLPLSKTFGYLCALTIIAVVYDLLWSWDDLNIKRMELSLARASTLAAIDYPCYKYHTLDKLPK